MAGPRLSVASVVLPQPLQIALPRHLLFNGLVRRFPIRSFDFVLEHGLLDQRLLALAHCVTQELLVRASRNESGKPQADADGRLVRVNEAVVMDAAMVRKANGFVIRLATSLEDVYRLCQKDEVLEFKN